MAMVAAFKQKNTIEQTGFSLTPTGFNYCGKQYLYDDIVSILSIRAIHRTHYIPFMGTEDHDPAISFVLTLKDGIKAQVTEQSTLTYTSSSDLVEKLQADLDEIADRTFNQRIRKYLDKLESAGFFNYGVWRFFPKTKRFTDTSSGQTFSARDTDFFVRYGLIEVRNKSENFASKLLRKAKEQALGGPYGIPILEDGDVFLVMLDQFVKD